ncbi:MAG: glycosyltransferase, partial [Sphingobacteriales bacterium]
MDTISTWVSFIFEQAIFYYSVLIMFSYLILVILSVIEIRKYNLRCWYINHSALLNSQHVPGISVIAPAYNESETVINGVHTLLSLNYPKYEVIIVNDGSSDDTLQKLIDEYELAESSFYYHEEITTQPVRGVYKSKNPVYSKLIVIDK